MQTIDQEVKSNDEAVVRVEPQQMLPQKDTNKDDKYKNIEETETKLNELHKTIETTKDVAQLSSSIKEYCVVLVSNLNEQLFTKYFLIYQSYFIQYKFMELLSKKIKQFANSSEFLKAVFSLFEFLMQALKLDEDLIYFLLKINQEGFISSTYYFQQEEDIAYYANFLKLMVRKINEQQKYLSVFFNIREPHFPVLLKLLKFYDCPDVVMHTSSKLAIMQISNNKSNLVQKYFKNFPFVIFYPLYVGQILDSLKKALNQEKNEIHLQNVENHLRYMEDFIQNKDREAIDIYTNTFLRMIGLFIYSQLSLVAQDSNRVKKLYKILLKYVIPELSVIKIKTCLLLLFSTDISSKMKKCYSSKPITLDTDYWMFDKCITEVISHCKKIHYNSQQPTKSFFKLVNSYIPHTKDNWLYYEVRKIGELIGFSTCLEEPINHDNYLPDSFLNALWTMVDDKTVPNQIYTSLAKLKDQELLYYNLKVLTQLINCYNSEITLNMDSIVQEILICNSLSLVHIFYEFVLRNKIHFQQSLFIQQSYSILTEKLIHFILTKGMAEFLIRVRDSRVKEYDNKFTQDIYREIQCQILLFVALRTLLDFPNSQGNKFETASWNNQQNVTAETTFKCHAQNQNGAELSVILDGQYMKIKNRFQHLIHRQELLLQQIRFYEQQDSIILNGSQRLNNYSTTIHIQPMIKPYILKEINHRKELATKIMLNLRSMQFQFKY